MNEKTGADPEAIVQTVNTWLGNPLTRSLLKFASNGNGKGSRLELGLKKYAGLGVRMSLLDRITYRVIKFAIDRGAGAFGTEKELMVESLRNPVFRRAIVNVLEGIAHFGVQRPQTTGAPLLVVWNYTHICNLKCKHCYENSDGTFLPDELTTEEAKKIIDQFKEASVVSIAFSGGEPLLRPDFFEVAKYASDNDFYVSVASNGTLIDKKTAKKLRESGVEYIEISLDGFEKEHDKFRGVPGAWKKTCRGIRNCVSVGLDTCVATTVTKQNLKNLPKLIDFVEKDLKANRMIFFNFVPTRRGKDIAKDDITPQEREKLLKLLYSKLLSKNCPLDTFSTAPQYGRIAAEFPEGPAVATHFTNKAAINALKGRTRSLTEFIGGCGAGRLYCGLEPNGDMFPCVFIPIKIGNLRNQRLKSIWHSSEVLKKMRKRDEFEGCGDCENKYICGGCRARAYGYFGNIQGPDPGCINNIKYWNEINSKTI